MTSNTGLRHAASRPDRRRAKLIVFTETDQYCRGAAFGVIAGIESQLESLLGRRALIEVRYSLRRIIADADEPGP